jgi:hypothetical protein
MVEFYMFKAQTSAIGVDISYRTFILRPSYYYFIKQTKRIAMPLIRRHYL